MYLKTNGLPSGLGYLELDHRASPEAPNGLPRYFEADTYTCTHCSAVVILNPNRLRERYKCRGCNHHICDNCEAERIAGGPCRTMAQKIDEYMEAVQTNGQVSSILLP
jgi:hypothetical protein